MQLNSESRVAVRYGARVRKVILKAGEVFFTVAKYEERPFIVVVNDRQIVATGTSFIVRSREGPVGLSVTLVAGQLAVTRPDTESPRSSGRVPPVNLTTPGQRVRFIQERPVADSKPLNEVTAWTRGEILFLGTPLKDALVQINRYSPRLVRLAEPTEGAMLIDGTFRLGDAASFARVIADCRHLQLIERKKEFILEPLEEAPASEPQ
jgi:transmembrane sensor